MKNFFTIFLLLIFCHVLYAQNEFTSSIFGEGIGFTEGFNAIETTDGGYLLIGGRGHQDLDDPQNPWIIKLNQESEILWESEVDFAGDDVWDFGIDAIEVEDGYTILGNFVHPVTSSFSASIIKLDFDGNLLWTHAVEDAIFSEFGSIVSTGDNGFVISGAKDYVMTMMKFDNSGNLLWEQSYYSQTTGISFYQGDITLSSDGGILSTLSSFGGAILLKTDGEGNLIWYTEMDGKSGMSVKELGNGDILVLTSEYTDGDLITDNHLVHLSADGAIINKSMFSSEIIETTRDMTIDAEENVYISGMNGTTNTAVVLKTNLTGDTLWTRTFVPEEGSGLAGLSFDGVTFTSDGDLILSGAGWMFLPNGFRTPAYFYFMKMTLDGEVSSIFNPVQEQDNVFDVYPVPAREQVTFSSDIQAINAGYIQLFDLFGREVRKEKFDQNNFEVRRSGLASGSYIYCIYSHSGALMSRGQLIFD